MPNSSVSLAAAIKWKSQEIFLATPMMFYIAKKKNSLDDSFELHLLADDFRILA
jgi:hypothetical protein